VRLSPALLSLRITVLLLDDLKVQTAVLATGPQGHQHRVGAGRRVACEEFNASPSCTNLWSRTPNWKCSKTPRRASDDSTVRWSQTTASSSDIFMIRLQPQVLIASKAGHTTSSPASPGDGLPRNGTSSIATSAF
jgi:hypothetical protein